METWCPHTEFWNHWVFIQYTSSNWEAYLKRNIKTFFDNLPCIISWETLTNNTIYLEKGQNSLPFLDKEAIFLHFLQNLGVVAHGKKSPLSRFPFREMDLFICWRKTVIVQLASCHENTHSFFFIFCSIPLVGYQHIQNILHIIEFNTF